MNSPASDAASPPSDIKPARAEYSVQPLVRSLVVLRHIAAGNRCRNLSRAAKETGVNRTTLIRILATFEAEGIIEPLPEEGGWRLGPGLITLARTALDERDIVQVARPVLRDLVADLGLSAHLAVRDGTDVIYLARETPVSFLASTVREGTRLPAHATTIGRILLAELDSAQIREMYAGRVLTPFTKRSPTDLDALVGLLEADRRNGFAWSTGNFEAGIGSAAAVVRDHTGTAVAAVNVTGQVADFDPAGTRATAIRDRVLRAAADISRAMGYSGAA